MISLNESIDFEFFETSSNAEPDRKASTGSAATFLDVWEIDSGSLRYSGSHASLLNNLAFENSPANGRAEDKTRGGDGETDRGRASSRYNEIKRTVALASEQDDVDPIETDDSSSNPLSLNEIIDLTCRKKNREQIKENSSTKSCDISATNYKKDLLDESAANETEKVKERTCAKIEYDEYIDENKLNEKINTNEIEKPIAILDQEEEKIEIDKENVKASNKRKFNDNRSNPYDSDDEMYYSGKNNQITTVVEVHAENDLSDIEEDSELDIANDSLIPEQDGIEMKINVKDEKEIHMKYIDPHELKAELKTKEIEKEAKESDNNEKYDHRDSHETEANMAAIYNKNSKRESEVKEDNKVDIENNDKKKNIETLENGITQSLNQIKHYNARTTDNDAQYSYEAIEKKIESANKHMLNVKAVNITSGVEMKNTTGERMLDKINKPKAENRKITNNSSTTPLDIRLGRTSKSETQSKVPKLETVSNLNRERNTPRQELPLLSKPLTKKITDIKVNRKSEDKIPQIKNEASFDMRLLIKAINELENTKPKTGCTRSNSARSSDISKQSNNSKNSINSKKSTGSTKSNASTSKRANMSFSKDEAKKIDLENQILLKKIMSQKPQAPPGNAQHTRRKPTAYINRQKLQDRISHDNTILEKKLMSIKKRKERISVL